MAEKYWEFARSLPNAWRRRQVALKTAISWAIMTRCSLALSYLMQRESPDTASLAISSSNSEGITSRSDLSDLAHYTSRTGDHGALARGTDARVHY